MPPQSSPLPMPHTVPLHSFILYITNFDGMKYLLAPMTDLPNLVEQTSPFTVPAKSIAGRGARPRAEPQAGAASRNRGPVAYPPPQTLIHQGQVQASPTNLVHLQKLYDLATFLSAQRI
jgi:hypothetical protein